MQNGKTVTRCRASLLPILAARAHAVSFCLAVAVAHGEVAQPPQICATATLILDVPKALAANWTMSNSAFVEGFEHDVANAIGVSPHDCTVLSCNKCACLGCLSRVLIACLLLNAVPRLVRRIRRTATLALRRLALRSRPTLLARGTARLAVLLTLAPRRLALRPLCGPRRLARLGSMFLACRTTRRPIRRCPLFRPTARASLSTSRSAEVRCFCLARCLLD